MTEAVDRPVEAPRPGAAGFPLVIAAPSGAGKTTLARALVERAPNVVFSVSATTRPRRHHERDRVDYHFVDDVSFDVMLRDEELVEWAEVHGHRYGTPREGIDGAVARGTVVVLDIDVQGAMAIRRHYPEAVLVFILPPDAAELGRRLAGRGSEAEADRRRRLGNARRELPSAGQFDYVVVNDDFKSGIAALESIVVAERHRVMRVGALDGMLLALDSELETILEES